MIEEALTQTELEELPYYKDLILMRRILLQVKPGFPIWACQDASHCISSLIPIKNIAGTYLPTKEWHAWNYDPERQLYVDMTMDQFDSTIPPLIVVPTMTRHLYEIKSRTLEQKKFISEYTKEVALLYNVSLPTFN